MTAAAGVAMALWAVFADGFSWPGATAVDAADLESLDRGQRQRAVERLGRPGVLGEVRLRVVRLLEDARDKRAVTLLLGRLADSARQVNLESIAALGTLGDPGAAPALVRTLDSGADDLRLAAIDALGALGWAGAVPVLAPIARRR